MTARVLRPAFTISAVIAVLVAALAVYAYSSAGTSHADSVYNPTLAVKYCNALPATYGTTVGVPALNGDPACAETLTPGAAANYTTVLDMAGDNLNFSQVVTFAPATSGTTALAAGTLAGGLRSLTNLGLINGACNTALTVDFVLYSTALPNNTGAPRSSTNIVFPKAEGQSDRFGHWKVGGVATTSDTPPGSAPRATGSSIAIQNYPSYLLDIFDPDFVPGVGDGPAHPVLPTAVYGGLTVVSGNWIPLYFVEFAPGALTSIPGPFSLMTAAMGKPSVSVLNDPTAVQASPSTITDFCTPLNVTNMILGAARSNPPAAGTHYHVQYNASLRDTDQDGYENAIDTCPVTVNAGNPRFAGPGPGGDSDGDGIDNACDTNGPYAGSSCVVNGGPTCSDNDVDDDGFDNRQDNCPQVHNPTQQEDELGAGPAADLGPRTDGIGSACDTGVVSLTQNSRPVSITLSPTVGNGRYHVIANLVPKCFGGTDADGDGYCSTQDNQDNTGQACGSTVPVSCSVRHTAWSGAGHPGLQMDTDGDGFSDVMETYLGTDATKSCAQTPVPPGTSGGANDENLIDNWPLDFNDDRAASTPDILAVGGGFGVAVNNAIFPLAGTPPRTGQRLDLNHDGFISTPDVLRVGGFFGQRCGQGTPGLPGPWVQQ
jgi:hypothetical protein